MNSIEVADLDDQYSISKEKRINEWTQNNKSKCTSLHDIYGSGVDRCVHKKSV